MSHSTPVKDLPQPSPTPSPEAPHLFAVTLTVDCSMTFVLLTPFQQCKPAKQYDNFSLYN